MRKESFSEFEVKETSIRFLKDEAVAERVGCVGSLEETKETKIITKKCEGVIKKEKVKGSGVKIKLKLHMGYEAYAKSFGMLVDEAKDGIISYGELSTHAPFCLTTKALNEDDEVKFKAYPNCIIESGDTRTIENGGEEVAEIELEGRALPDEYGQCLYEVLEEDLSDEELKNGWMTNFDSSAVYITA